MRMTTFSFSGCWTEGRMLLHVVSALLLCCTRVIARPAENNRGNNIQHCQKLAARSNCHVFSCVDEQTDCANARTFRHSILNTFCHQIHHRRNSLSSKSQTWADSSIQCIMSEMKTYIANSKCPDVTGEVTRIFKTCFASDKQICHVLHTDTTTLGQIAGNRYWLDVVQAVSHCSRRDVTRFIMTRLRV